MGQQGKKATISQPNHSSMVIDWLEEAVSLQMMQKGCIKMVGLKRFDSHTSGIHERSEPFGMNRTSYPIIE